MKNLFLVLLVSFIILISGFLNAEEVISLDYLIREALANNPEILSAKKSFESRSARVSQESALSDPVIEYEYDKINADRELTGEPMKIWGISQEVPFPTKLYYRAKIASKLAKMSYENYKAKETKIISEVKSSYAELFLIYRSIDIERESKSLLVQVSATATTRYSAGEGTQADALKAQVELAKVENELIMLEQKRQAIQAKLNILINRDPKTEITSPTAEGQIEFTKPINEYENEAKQNNPELKAYRYAVERGKAAYDLSIHEFLPDFMFRYKRMVMDGSLSSENWAGMVGVTIPLWFFQKQVFGVKEMQAELDMLNAEYRMKENEVLYEIKNAFSMAEANKKLIELYESAFIPQADETFKASLKNYESGKGDFISLLDSQRMLIDFKLEHYRAITELRIALADLTRIMGVL